MASSPATEDGARRFVKAECRRLGATLAADVVGIHYEIRAEAPHGFVWAASFTHEVITATLGAYNWRAAVSDIRAGVKACDEPACEWCSGE